MGVGTERVVISLRAHNESAVIQESVNVASQSGKLMVVRESCSIVNRILRFVAIVLSSISSCGGVVVILETYYASYVLICLEWSQNSCHTPALGI